MTEFQSPSGEFLNEAQAAAFFGRCPRSLQRWRAQGIGPRYLRIGKRRIYYRLADLQAYIEEQCFGSIAEERQQTTHNVAA